MLIKAFIENFKSFNDRTEFNMITSNKIRKKSEHEVNLKNISLLKNAVIFGANAAGKSNFIEFFAFFKYCVESKIPLSAKNSFCKLKEENINKLSCFEIQFSIGENIYDYGFKILLSERKISEEWLYELKGSKESLCIFESSANGKPETGLKNLSKDDEAKFKTYAEDYQYNKNNLFLTELNRNKKYNDDSPLAVFRKVYNWITRKILVYRQNLPITNFQYFYDAESLEKINNLIASFDTGIQSAKIEELSFEELNKKLPENLFNSLKADIAKCAEQNLSRTYSMRSSDEFYNVSVNGNSEPVISTIKFNHVKSFYDYNFDEESDGTRRLFDLIDMLLIKADDVVFVMDELERSLHPKLTQRFIKLFNEIHSGKNIQLIFTTHESTIMDQEFFRRDEIWFVERGADNSSSIYSLDIFKERYDKKLNKDYLDGRYGAIPIFKQI